MSYSRNNKISRGFTIVELLIVIVVIGILAAITIVAYNGIQGRARQSKFQAEIQIITKAAQAAEASTGKPLGLILGAWYPNCGFLPSGTNLAALVGTSDSCWTQYVAWMQALSTASGMTLNPNSLLDPWGRPYMIDPNEAEANSYCTTKDTIAVWTIPYATSNWGNSYPGSSTYSAPLSGNASGVNGC